MIWAYLDSVWPLTISGAVIAPCWIDLARILLPNTNIETAMKPVPNAIIGRKDSPTLYAAPLEPYTVNALKLVAAIVTNKIGPFSPLPAK